MGTPGVLACATQRQRRWPPAHGNRTGSRPDRQHEQRVLRTLPKKGTTQGTVGETVAAVATSVCWLPLVGRQPPPSFNRQRQQRSRRRGPLGKRHGPGAGALATTGRSFPPSFWGRSEERRVGEERRAR